MNRLSLNYLRKWFRGFVATFALTLGVFSSVALAQNPVPQVVGPPNPQAVKPGGKDFTLKVYGANFVPGSVVNWNRHPRVTTYISGHEVDATILACDIVTDTAGYITVTNPPPGGGTSSTGWGLVEVHQPRKSIQTGVPEFYGSFEGGEVTQLLVGDFNNDGVMDLVAGGNTRKVPVLLGDGDGGFHFAHYATYTYYGTPASEGTGMAYGDFNGDGILDLAYSAVFSRTSGGLVAKLGNGDGSFRQSWVDEQVPDSAFVVGDFNRDGELDIVSGYDTENDVLLGNGDGTFKVATKYTWGAVPFKFAGDFNGDGKLDLLVNPRVAPGYTALALVTGNGDGTFNPPQRIITYKAGCAFGPNVAVGDFNGDGKLDFAFCTLTGIQVMLGNGDGTFQKAGFYTVYTEPPGYGSFSFAMADFNSDGKTDLLVSWNGLKLANYVLWGNGDGTFQPKIPVNLSPAGTDGELGIAVGDFNSDGLLDFAFQEGGYGFEVYPQK